MPAMKMDAIALLKADHRKVEALFDKFDKARAKMKKALADRDLHGTGRTRGDRGRNFLPGVSGGRWKTICGPRRMSSMTAPRC